MKRGIKTTIGIVAIVVCLMMTVVIIMSGLAIAGTQIQSLDIHRKGNCIDLVQADRNSTYQTIVSVQLPNKQISLIDKNMTSLGGGYYNYSYCNTSYVGKYFVNGYDNDEQWAYDFIVTNNGTEYTTAQSITYIFVLLLSVGLFILCFTWAWNIETGNIRNSDGEIMAVNYKKHLKLFLVVMCYMVAMWVFFVSWNITLGYLDLPAVASFFRFLYTFMLAMALPITVVWILVAFIMFVRDLQIEKKLERGFTME